MRDAVSRQRVSLPCAGTNNGQRQCADESPAKCDLMVTLPKRIEAALAALPFPARVSARAYLHIFKANHMLHRIHWTPNCSATTTKGKRCKALALPRETVCVRHLPTDDPRRVAFLADQARRIRAAAERKRSAKAAAAGMTVIPGQVTTKTAA